MMRIATEDAGRCKLRCALKKRFKNVALLEISPQQPLMVWSLSLKSPDRLFDLKKQSLYDGTIDPHFFVMN